MRLNDAITTLKGVGEKTAQTLEKYGITSPGQLLYYFPRDYIQIPYSSPISDAKEQTSIIIRGQISSDCQLFQSRGKSVLSFSVSDQTGSIRIFFFGMPYLKKVYPRGREVIFYGKVLLRNGTLFLSHPKLLSEKEYQETAGHFQPVYRLFKGMTNQKIQKLVQQVFSSGLEADEYLHKDILEELHLLPVMDAIHEIHFPCSMESVTKARQRLAFDEFYFFLLQLQILKGRNEKHQSGYRIEKSEAEDRLLDRLPYKLTNGQRNALEDISRDMQSGFQMNRLLQGDVGCGKTIVAFIAMLNTVCCGYQAALMAPTEVLAMQHYADICTLAEKFGLPIHPGILSGSMSQKEKRLTKEKLRNKEINFLVGTHALLQDTVDFANLALIVCDEQHRFGVSQRLTLSEKGMHPHILVMSATPIPRTLGLILYGDLDVTLIHELPSSRKPIKNTVVGPEYRTKLYQFIMKQIQLGHQAYIICPMVEENEDMDIENVMDYRKNLTGIFPASVKIEALHGKMKPREKDAIMNRFASGEINILVSTTVVEVGVNVPNATVMMVENAERFGLSQLHQLRGRVGRGEAQSYCIFLLGTESKKAAERLSVMAKTNDGFEIANEDLKQRGPGDFFGYRQAGMPGFQIADIYSDSKLLEQVKNLLEKQMQENPMQLTRLYHSILRSGTAHFMNLHDICL